MCLACELDALWYAEWERLAADRANAATTSGNSSAPLGEPVGAPVTAAASATPMASSGEETESTGGGPAVAATPAFPGSADEIPAVPTEPARPGALRSGFRCEEAE